MPNLWDKISQDIVTAMKTKDVLTLSVLRMVKAASTHAAIEKKKDRLEDPDILDVLARQLKQRKESFDSFSAAGRMDLAEKEKAEMAVLECYLPAQLSALEIETLVRQSIHEAGAASKADTGRVMALLMPKIKGTADGKTVIQLVQKLLP